MDTFMKVCLKCLNQNIVGFYYEVPHGHIRLSLAKNTISSTHKLNITMHNMHCIYVLQIISQIASPPPVAGYQRSKSRSSFNIKHPAAGYGVRSDGKILFINASTCDINYLPCNPPVVFDVTIPPQQL